MEITVVVKNYRCFEDTQPVRFCLQKGIVSVVGKNNSGKSSLLRLYYELRAIFQQLRDGKIVDAMRQQQTFNLPVGIDVRTLFCDLNQRDIVLSVEARDSDQSCLLSRIDIVIPRGQNSFRVEIPGSEQHGKGVLVRDDVLTVGGQSFSFESMRRVFGALAACMYIGPYRNAINVNAIDGMYYDLFVGQNFIAQWDQMQTGSDPALQVAAYRVTKDVQRVFEIRELESRASNDNRQIRLMVDGRPYELQSTGAGLAQFFVVLGNIALVRPSYVLIDEPELNLHPALQSDFVSTIESYCSEGVVIATHSLGLARTVSHRTYAMTKKRGEAARLSDLEAVPRLSEFVGALSFSDRPELGFSRLLLVESRTDIRAMQHFLRLLEKDHHVVPLPLGGNTLINAHQDTEHQLIELTRITNAANIHAVIDSEIDGEGVPLPPNRVAFRELCQRVGIGCHVLERRAIENYLPDSAIQATLGPGHPPIGKFGRPSWNKNENGHIARNAERSELEGTDLWQFLARV